MAREFIEGWDLLQILGEGTFGEVKLLVNRATGEACAMKEIDLAPHDGDPATRDAVLKEICVHKLLKHDNVVRCYGARSDESGNRQFIFLEYCAGGELFDKIEPEVGMPEHQAHCFFMQLLDAVEYLHEKGVVHRDIKPENLLLTEGEVLKLSDFGLATVFRHNEKERLLERRCGTMPYIAPEVLVKSRYNAMPADTWSCGMVLLAMLVGELPWDHPTAEDPVYEEWRSKDYSRPLFQRLDTVALSLLRKVLSPAVSKRATVAQIRQHLWCRKSFKDKDGNPLEPQLVSRPLKRSHPDFNATQPLPEAQQVSVTSDRDNIDFPSFSQPAFEGSGSSLTQTQTQGSTQSNGGSNSVYQKLVKRVTRFWTDAAAETAMTHVRGVCQKLGYKVETKAPGQLTLTTTDRRGAQLVIKCSFITIDSRLMVDFRMSRGCGLEFKRGYRTIKANCEPIVNKAPVLWPTVLPLKALPGVEKASGDETAVATEDKENSVAATAN